MTRRLFAAPHVRLAVVLVLAVVLALAGCGSPRPGTGDGRLAVVASTDVYGSIAEAVGGDAVRVTSIVADPNRDPHSYEADAQDQLALTKAAVVVENGAGYDDFVDTLLRAAPVTGRTVIDVAEVSGYDQDPAGGAFNEHLWYDFPTMLKLAERLRTAFTAARPGRAAVLAENTKDFVGRLEGFEARERAIAGRAGGRGVAITEPVPLYLLQACGLQNRTPEAFSAAVEEERDVAPAVLQQTLALFSERRVALLAYNAQTGGPQTDQLLAAARAASVPAVPVTETLPAGRDYLSWMSANLDAVERAVSA